MKDVRIEIPDRADARNVNGYNLSRTVAIYRDGRWYSGSCLLLPLSLSSFLFAQARAQGIQISKPPVKVAEVVEDKKEKKEPKVKNKKEKKNKVSFNPFLLGGE
jgi:hypothetical protein